MKNLINKVKLKIKVYFYKKYFIKNGYTNLEAEILAKNIIEINHINK